jgi:hypothetical protein
MNDDCLLTYGKGIISAMSRLNVLIIRTCFLAINDLDIYPLSISAVKLYTIKLPGRPSTLSGKVGSIMNLKCHSCLPGAMRCVDPVCIVDEKMICSSLTRVPRSLTMLCAEVWGVDGPFIDHDTFHLPSSLTFMPRIDMWSGISRHNAPVRGTGSASC